jgi:uncharacterized lipoprotein YajG
MVMHTVGRLAAAFILAAVFSGCAEKGPILLNVAYQEPAEKTAATSTVTVGVSPLTDARGKTASVLGIRKIPNGQENELVTQGSVAELATAGLKQALLLRGIAVKDMAGWDLTAEGMKAEGVALLLGGEIKTLWIESGASGLKTHLKATVKLRIVAGDPAERKIVRTVEVSSALEQDVLYSREKLEQTLSEALTTAIDQIFKDEDLKKRLP